MNQKGQAGVLILVGILIIVAVAGGAYYLGMQKGGSAPTPTTTTTYSPTPSTPDETVYTESDRSVDTEATRSANWKTYTNREHGISFKHPDFDDSCCGIPGPASGNPIEVVVLADKLTGKPSTDAPFNGLAVFLDSNTQKLSFTDYITNQKQAWLQWEKTTVEPKSSQQKSESQINIGGMQGIILKDYAGWADMIYIPFPNNQKILIIAKTQVTADFSTIFDQILSTFKFID